MRPIVDWFGIPYTIFGYGKNSRGILKGMNTDELSLSLINVRDDRKVKLNSKDRSYLKNLERGRRNVYGDGIERNAIEVWNLSPLDAFLKSYSLNSFSDDKVYKILYSVYEAKTIPSEWVSLVEGFNELWSPSEFSRDSFLNAGVDIRNTRIIPEGVNTDKMVSGLRPLKDSDAFVFLSIFDFSYRKGWDKLVKAYCDEFSEDEDALLLIKTSYYGLNRKEEISSSIGSIKSNSKHSPSIQLITDRIEEDKMPNLYNSGDAFVLSSLGEGFGLPLVEAASCGLPIITTKFSAPFEILDGCYWVDYNLGEFPFERAIVHESNCAGLEFADPDINSLRNQMRKVFEEDEHKVPDVSDLTWENGAKKATERLKKIWEGGI